MIRKFFNDLFEYKKTDSNEFIIPKIANNINPKEFEKKDITTVSPELSKNMEYLKVKYNMLINSDIKIREFTIKIKPKKYSAFIIYIDGMVSDETISDFILKPLLLKNSIKMKPDSAETFKRKLLNFNLEKFLYSSLIPQNSISEEKEFDKIVSNINAGFCVLFVDSLDTAIAIEAKGFKGRSVSEPVTETVVKGSHEAFVENLRTNTSLLRKIINNENLIIEESTVGKISNTKIAICYMKDIANDDLVYETKYRINNLEIDSVLSSGQLEQFIKDSATTAFPQTISTERPDKTSNYLLEGRVVVLVNGSPFSIILPAVLVDFLTSPEDVNLNFNYANFLRILRCFALTSALLLPGLYIAITMYHCELIPSELLFAIIAARAAIPFPIFFEIMIMELSFELIQEASIRVPSSFSTTVRNYWSFNFRRSCSFCKYCKSNSYNYCCFYRNFSICNTR